VASMIRTIVAGTASTLGGLSALHYAWSARPRLLNPELVVPYSAGRPLFRPGPKACRALSLILLGMAGVLTAASFNPVPRAGRFLKVVSFLISLVFAMRSVGDFRYIGFFKSRRNSKFARLDTALYSPLCVFIALGSLLAALPDCNRSKKSDSNVVDTADSFAGNESEVA
jgi:hypothetical protein